MTSITPAARTRSVKPYRRAAPAASAGTRHELLHLDANEGPLSLMGRLAFSPAPDDLRGYPDVTALEDALAARLSVRPEQIIATAGGDDALQRVCQAVLEPGASAVATTPTFEMIPRYASLAGGELRQVPWMRGSFPTGDVINAVTADTQAVFVVTPNNPTGGIASAQDLRRISAAAPHALLVVDLAYTELADIDLTPVALSLPNTIIVRTFSKAWGLAGLRVGYAAGCEQAISLLRAVGQPYAVSGPSASLALRALSTLDTQVAEAVAVVREERAILARSLARIGCEVLPSQGNFVLAMSPRSAELHAFLRDHGIIVREFHGRPGLDQALRITCPGDATAFARLIDRLESFR
ncbi:MAG: Histidinol-phosphate aminotransferase [Phycisphaerales bacterium]|nr:Histidinol-phosphate aminotransferase [Phycisphaerales bacterium]